jgi:glycosyltransferase involved in cell wall biosynthesis
MIQRTGGGLLVQPDDARALADGLASIFADTAKGASLGSAGAAGVRRHYTVARMADRALEVYAAVAGQTKPGRKTSPARGARTA